MGGGQGRNSCISLSLAPAKEPARAKAMSPDGVYTAWKGSYKDDVTELSYLGTTLRRCRVWEVQIGCERKLIPQEGVPLGQGTGEVGDLPPSTFQDLSKQSHGCSGSPSSRRRLEKTC